jgi:hypothetical protein
MKPILDYPYIYHWANLPKIGPIPERADHKGKKCRILARGKRNSIQLEFEDGHRTITSGNSIRRA